MLIITHLLEEIARFLYTYTITQLGYNVSVLRVVHDGFDYEEILDFYCKLDWMSLKLEKYNCFSWRYN